VEIAKPAAGRAVLGTQLISLDLLLGKRGREVGNLKEIRSALPLLRYLPRRDLAHSRVLKLEGFKKKSRNWQG